MPPILYATLTNARRISHGSPVESPVRQGIAGVRVIDAVTTPLESPPMRYSLLAVALAAATGSASFAADAANSDELAQLKEQLAALQAKVVELESRSDAQSDINV